MINKILLVLLLFISGKAYTQTFKFDKGSGTRESLKTGVLVIKLIQQNNLSELLKLMQPQSKVDTAQLATGITETNKLYPYDSVGVPGVFVDKLGTEFYYERNFCIEKNKKTEILLQIHVNLIKKDNDFFIRNIEFRKEKAIVKREAEIKKLNNVPKEPPPPPAIF